MFRLWCLAEEDLLSSDANAGYDLKDTGQGYHRVQQCPKTFYAMQDILHKTQRRVGNWVGSSVIHLGDHNVPNALMFIDKYTQVSTGPCGGSPPAIVSSECMCHTHPSLSFPGPFLFL